ncbi:MAG TPA: hypothetical protein PKI03_22090, partial [Pseudomonadota bacterium]|nr:hypothetical protein [Pseudomonadota bacterium]
MQRESLQKESSRACEILRFAPQDSEIQKELRLGAAVRKGSGQAGARWGGTIKKILLSLRVLPIAFFAPVNGEWQSQEEAQDARG